MLLPPLGWWGTMKLFARQVVTILWEHRLSLSASVLLLGSLFWLRHLIADTWLMVNWRLRPGKRSATGAWRILSRRLRAHGWKTSQGITPRQLLRQIASAQPEFSTALQDFSSLLEREVFGDHVSSDNSKASECSNRILELLSRSTCRELAREHRQESASQSATCRYRHSSVPSHHPSVSA